MLPDISEKKFLLKGKVTGQIEVKSKSTRKMEVAEPSYRRYMYEEKKRKKTVKRVLDDFLSLRPWEVNNAE